MDGDVFENIVKFIMLALWVGWQVKKRTGNTATSAPPEPTPTPEPVTRRPVVRESAAPAQASVAARDAELAKWTAHLSRLEARSAELSETRASLESALRGMGSRARLLRQLYEERVVPPLDTAEATLVQLRSELTRGGPQLVANRLRHDPETQRAISDMAQADRHLGVIINIARMRTDPVVGPMLADADAVATRLLDPVQQFCRAQDLDFPQMEVVTVPSTGQESVWMGLLPDGHPVVLVPDDFGDDIFRWPSVAHEVGHILWWKVPGLAAEMRAVTGFGRDAALLRREGSQLIGALEQPLAAWLSELAADAFTALFLGPAALYGFVHAFARPDAPRAVLQAHDDGRGRYEEHPPAHLRVRLMAAMLERLGFEAHIRGEVARWDELHGFDENAGAEAPALPIFLPVEGGRDAAVAVEAFVERAVPALVALIESQYEALAGFAPTSVPGLEMTPGFWQKVERRAVDLSEGTPFRDAPDIVLAAAIVARHRQPGEADHIENNLRQAILGKDTSIADRRERRLAARRRASGEADSLAAAVRDAVVLSEVLPRRLPGFAPSALLRRR
jgi:hypothetical protein